jgi:hypothetical protein
MSMNQSEIRLVENENIDYEKWDRCIDNSPFGVGYAKSWFLDRICARWHALVWGDYLYVMPLTTNRKYGINYIYQPFFTWQLGIFSAFEVNPEIVNRFLNAVPVGYRLADIRLNPGNLPTTTSYQYRKNLTYQLNLAEAYPLIRENYTATTHRSIRKAKENNVWISPFYEVPQFIGFTRLNLRKKSSEIAGLHYQALQNVINFAVFHYEGELYGAWDSTNNLVAAAFFLQSARKSICMAALSNVTGMEQDALFLLIDTFIENNAGQNRVLNFEGPSVPGMTHLYAGFGAVPQTYYSAHRNRLPTLLRIFSPKKKK